MATKGGSFPEASKHMHTLLGYTIGVVIAMAILNGIAWYRGGAYPKIAGLVSLGFLLGMLAMYLAVNFYTQ
jgi:hypothetical protein